MTDRDSPAFPCCAAEILTVAEMYAADAAAIASGIAGDVLMENAGRAVAEQIGNRWTKRPIAILCGPGNNGGDGFVIARLLAEQGWPVTVSLLGQRNAYSGDAAIHAARWSGPVADLADGLPEGAALVVDALFGAGLARPLEGAARAVVDDINKRQLVCIAVDVPSGVQGDTGEVMGAAPRCALTVTFFRRKPGHLLLPGRGLAGEVVVSDIGIPNAVMAAIGPSVWENGPALWGARLPWPGLQDHKYTRGHALIAGGAEMTGAARLAARAAYRIGAGLVSVAAPPAAVAIYSADFAELIVKPVVNEAEFADLLEDKRRNAVLVGPGGGVGAGTRAGALAALRSGKAVVLDADALTVFAGRTDELYSALAPGHAVLTPHEGEFSRLFDMTGDKLARCRGAAAKCGAVVLLKGADTIIAAPDGRAAINANAPATLATAGSGDVLAGCILGLLAQGMEPFEAAAAAAWIQGDAAAAFGPGLMASDIVSCIPGVLRRLRDGQVTAVSG
jgi:NAD(P)H-hydrate epimerase